MPSVTFFVTSNVKSLVCFRDVLNSEGAVFEIKSDFSDPYAEGLFDDDVNDDIDDEELAKLKNPWDVKFEELKLKMEKISDQVYKLLKTAGNPDKICPARARVTMHYNGYYEGKTDGPFDSSYLRGDAAVSI